MEGRKLNEYIGYINEIELMRNRIKSFREYAEKINRKTGGNVPLQEVEDHEEVHEEGQEEEDTQEHN